MTTNDELRDRMKTQWNASAAGWERWDDWMEASSRDVTTWMCDAADLAPGMTVVDLACGAGQPALTAARRVAPNGKVIATDLAPEMLEVVRRKAARLGLGNVELRTMEIERIELPDMHADAVTCRFGLMFCIDPERGAREIRRVLRPGGRGVIVVWGEPAKNPFFAVPAQVIARFVPSPPPDPNAPGVFRLAAPGALERALAAADFDEVAIAPMPTQFRFDSLDQYWAIQSDMSSGLRNAIASLSADQVRALKEAMFAAFAPFTGPDGVVFEATPLCARVVR
jgi:ubiquinone/menaquinone biosynthesis C-methylase UbiE